MKTIIFIHFLLGEVTIETKKNISLSKAILDFLNECGVPEEDIEKEFNKFKLTSANTMSMNYDEGSYTFYELE